ncbi:MAG: hypothetical protein JWN72_1284 [Thermoleophilia bacterium]|nr:hypothetical protein [Thermoleophilia bacterium]
MSATTDRPAVGLRDGTVAPLARAEGLELLGDVDGSGYEQGAALVRRADGQVVQLGPLMFALLEEIDGQRDNAQLAAALCAKLGRDCEEQHVASIGERLVEQGLLAGSEANAPERANPLLALRWKLVVTDPERTGRITAPFTWLHRAWVVAPVLLAFVAVCWFVLVEKGVASAAAQAFDRPELILLVFVLGVASAAFHELGHASACRYGGGRPSAMGAGIYLVWPAFYTDVTDAYRLPRGARLRTDLGGLYFNAIVAVATLATWLVLRVDALLLLIGLQLLEMVKQLSPVIRADGYHILSDATGVPDLYAHIVPTLKRLIPGHRRSGSALTGRARVLVTAWVLVVVPVLLSLTISAVLLLPKLLASTWESGRDLVTAVPDQFGAGHVVDGLVSVLRLLALGLPVIGSVLIVRRLVVGSTIRAWVWSRGHAARRILVATAAAGLVGVALWAWWPAGQYQPVRASDRGAIGDVHQLVDARPVAARSTAPRSTKPTAAAAAAPTTVPAGTHLAISLTPEGGATEERPAIYVITDPEHPSTPIVIASGAAPATDDAAAGGAAPAADATSPAPATTAGTAFAFDLPEAPGANDSQALAVNRTDGGTTYEIAYSLVTVHDGDAVDERNGAHAYANCTACTTVAVSFQVVLVVGTSPVIAPINIAEALNGNCPACVTTAIANQIVVSIGSEPSQDLLARLTAELERLDAIDDLGADATPASIAAQVGDVQRSIDQILADSGELTEAPDGEAGDAADAGADAATTPTTGTDADAASTQPASPQSTDATSTQTTTTPSAGSTSDPAQEPVTDPATASPPAGDSSGGTATPAPSTSDTAATTP